MQGWEAMGKKGGGVTSTKVRATNDDIPHGILNRRYISND
jgi:hypothetical protein